MSDYDPSALVAQCESILADGEISGEELYRLAEWLNDHKEACYEWPGNLLVQPLQDAWSDGKINKTEMRRIGRLLVRIQKEWAKSQSEIERDEAAALVMGILDDFNFQEARLPDVPFDARIRSHSDRLVSYEVNLSGPSCSCPDWLSHRRILPAGHLSKCCKHILDAYCLVQPDGGWPGWLGGFFETEYLPHPEQEWKVIFVSRSPVLISSAPTGWANVFVKISGEFERFGYSIGEDRWSYMMAPPGQRQIVKELHQLCGIPPKIFR